MRYIKYMFAAFIPLVMTAQTIPSPEHKQFSVLVLDALNGKAQAGFEVLSSCESKGLSKSDFEQAKKTDPNGIAQIPFRCNKNDRIQLSVTQRSISNNYESSDGYDKQECGYLEPQSLEQILTVGLISKPTAAGGIWCPTKISKKMNPVPGQVIIFVKKPTWWQVHVAP